jgi:ubiquinone/menaquinone biosynthesis C-methylase UbiE
MQRTPEPELMNEEAQALAYAQANFDEPHDMFIQAFKDTFAEDKVSGHILDMGCGPADISIRFAQAYTGCGIDGLDGAPRMLEQGKLAIQKARLQDRIHLLEGIIPGANLPRDNYDVIISNSLLHHLHEPDVLWESIQQFGSSGSRVFIMDLMRPESEKDAREFVDLYASDEPEVLRNDFYHSLCAAFSPEEIQLQLDVAGLSHLELRILSDRHVAVSGIL